MTLNPIPGKRREMQIPLTEKGKVHANEMLEAIYCAENQAMEKMLETYSTDFVNILGIFVKHLRSAFEQEAKKDNDTLKGGTIVSMISTLI